MSSFGDKEKIENILSNLSCSICGEKYDERKIRPKSLICKKTTHSFCITCIKKLISDGDGTFSCPTCRFLHTSPPDGIDANDHYMDNKDLLELRDLLQITKQKDERNCMPCDLCEISDHEVREAVAWCGNCYVTMCKECRKVHDYIRDHPQSTPTDKIDWSTVKRKTLCKKHKGEFINFVCYEHDEVEFICSVCAEDSRHKGHDLKDLNEEAANLKREIDELYSNAVKINKIDLKRKKMLEMQENHLPRNLDAVEKQLNTCIDQLIKILEEQKIHKRHELKRIKEQTTRSLSKETDETTQRCSTFLKITNAIKKFNFLSPVAMVNDRKLLENLREYLALDIDKAPTTNVYMKVDDNDASGQLKELLQSSTQIKRFPETFQYSYPAVAFKDHYFKLAIQSMSENEASTVGGLLIRAEVQSSFCGTYENILPNHEVCGKYVFNFTPKSTGEYNFHIFVESKKGLEKCLSVAVHSLEVDYEKLVFCNEACQMKAHFDIRADNAEKLTVECMDEMGDYLKPVDKVVTNKMLSSKFQPNNLGKIKMYITFDGMRVAGPFTSIVCKRMIKGPLPKCDITHLALHNGSVYLADTRENRRILSVKPDNDPVTVDNFDNKGTSFIAFDEENGNRYVLFAILLNDAFTTDTKAESHISSREGNCTSTQPYGTSNDFTIVNKTSKTKLHISTKDGKKTYTLQSLKIPAGFAVSPSGSVFAISDQEDYCVFLYQTPQFTDKIENIEPFRALGKKDERLETFSCLRTFNNPTALCIDNENRLFVCDKGNSRIQVLEMNGKQLSVYGPEEVRSLETPEAICLSPEGYLLISGRDKLFTFNVNHQQSHQRPINEIEICCKGQNICNFNHLLCCLPNKQVLRFCCGYNDMQIFTYVSRAGTV